MQKDTVFKKSKVVVSRLIKPETLVLPIKAGSANLNEVYLLNETAGRMWELLDGNRTAGEVIAVILEEYETSEEEVQSDFESLVTHLEKLAVLDR